MEHEDLFTFVALEWIVFLFLVYCFDVIVQFVLCLKLNHTLYTAIVYFLPTAVHFLVCGHMSVH